MRKAIIAAVLAIAAGGAVQAQTKPALKPLPKLPNATAPKPAAKAAPKPTPKAVAPTKIDQGDWLYAGASSDGDLIMFVRSAKGTGDRAWVRYEAKKPEKSMSSVGLYEFNCETGQSKRLSMTDYAKNNMIDVISSNDTSYANWSYIIPGSMLENAFDWACQEKLGFDPKSN